MEMAMADRSEINNDVEIAVHKEDILKILGWSYSKFRRYRGELLDAGVIFYRNEGRPPQQKLCAFPSLIKRWIGIKARQGEKI